MTTTYFLTGGQTVAGAADVNVASYANMTHAVTVNLATGTDNAGDTFTNMQWVIGTNDSDTFILGGAAATVIGGYGYDTYQFNLGSGVQTIVNGDASNATPKGVLKLGAGISLSNLWITWSANDLVINVGGTNDKLTVSNWFANSYSKMDQLVLANGATLFTDQIYTLAFVTQRYQSEHARVDLSTAFSTDPGLRTEINAIWAGTSTWVNGMSQTYSAAGLGVQTLIDFGGSSNTLVGNASSVIVGRDLDTLMGSGVFVANGSNIAIQGTPSQIDATSGSSISLWGGDYLVYAQSARIEGSISATGLTTINADNSTVDLSGASVLVSGSNNTVYVPFGATNAIEAGNHNNVQLLRDGQQALVSGIASTALANANNQVVTLLGSAEDVVIIGNQDHATIYGNDTVEVRGVGDTLALFGTGIVVTATGDTGTITYLGPHASVTYIGSNAELDLDANASLTLSGSGDTINGSRSGGDIIAIGAGTFDSNTLNLGSVGNQVTLGQGATHTTINTQTNTSAYDVVSLTYSGNGATLNLGNFAKVVASGDSNVFNAMGARIVLNSGHNNIFDVPADGNTPANSQIPINPELITQGASVTGSTVNVGFGGYVTFTGSASTLNLGGSNVIGIQGDANTINGGATGVFYIATGQANVLNVGWTGGNSNLSDLRITQQSTASASIVNAGSNSHLTLSGDGVTLNMAAGGMVSMAGSSNIVNMSGAGVSITGGANNIINLAAGSSANYVWVPASNVAGTVVNGGGAVTITTGGATVNAAANESVVLNGVGSTVHMTTGDSTTVIFMQYLGSNTLTVSGSSVPTGSLQIWDAAGPTGIWLHRSGNDLVETWLGGNRVVTISNWYADATHQLATFKAGNYSLANANVAGLVSAMATFEANYASNHGGVAFDPTTAINPITDSTVGAAISSAWHLF